MPASQPPKIQGLPGPLGKVKDLATVENYINLILRKVELAFGPLASTPPGGYIPYDTLDSFTKNHIETYLQSIEKWSDVSLDDIIKEFPDDYWSIFHHVGWEGTYCLTPLLIKLAFEGYLVSDEIVSTVENLFSRFPRLSDDPSGNFLDWMNMYDRYQILCILDMITLLSNDPLSLYPDGFQEGRRWWMRYYVDG